MCINYFIEVIINVFVSVRTKHGMNNKIKSQAKR